MPHIVATFAVRTVDEKTAYEINMALCIRDVLTELVGIYLRKTGAAINQQKKGICIFNFFNEKSSIMISVKRNQFGAVKMEDAVEELRLVSFVQMSNG